MDLFWPLLLVIPGLMFSVSCQKKLVDASPEPVVQEEAKKKSLRKRKSRLRRFLKIPDVIMQEDIYFDFDKSTLTPAAQDNLLRKAEWLRENSDVTVTIEGHCDDQGNQ